MYYTVYSTIMFYKPCVSVQREITTFKSKAGTIDLCVLVKVRKCTHGFIITKNVQRISVTKSHTVHFLIAKINFFLIRSSLNNVSLLLMLTRCVEIYLSISLHPLLVQREKNK